MQRRYLTPSESETIRQLIDEGGRRQDWVAAQIGIPKPNFNHMLARRRPAPSDLVEQVARVVGVRLLVIQPEEAIA